MSFPVFVLTISILCTPLYILDHHRRVQAGLERACEEISQQGYLYRRNGLLERTVILAQVAAAFYYYADLEVCSEVSFYQSKVLEDGETFDFIVDYQIVPPVPLLFSAHIKQQNRIIRRGWIGGKNDQIENEEDRDQWVFVGKGSTRYHQKSTCHYLSNNLTAVSVNDLETLRNNKGGRYYPCGVCQEGIGETVYIMPSGSHFHGDSQCRAIIAYVSQVKLSSVAHLGACSYCSGG